MIIDCAYYRDGARQQAAPMSIADAAACARREDGGFVWLGIHDPTEAEMQAIQDNFPVH
jgi:magnesium transporter